MKTNAKTDAMNDQNQIVSVDAAQSPLKVLRDVSASISGETISGENVRPLLG